jgi:hypothetical protein
MLKTNVVHLPDIEAKAWRVRFRTRPIEAQDRVDTITEPRTVHARWTVEDLRTPPSPIHDDGGKSLAVLWMPPGASADIEVPWLAGIPTVSTAAGRVVRAGLRTARVVWTDTLAIVYAAPEQLDEALDAVTRFTIAERDTAALEARMSAIWPAIRRDTRLTHTIYARDQWFRKAKVSRVTETVTAMASSALRLEATLEQLDRALQAGSKRLFAELALQAELYDRLEVLGEPIDFALEHYELITSRLLEAQQANGNLKVELAILFVLLCDLGFVAYPYLLG